MAGERPAARIGDIHTCPAANGPVPHVGGPILTGFPTVLIGGMPAARVTDLATCVGPPAMIVKGSATVFIGGLPAARMGDQTVHGGIVVTGCPTVLIGDAGSGGGGAGAAGGAAGGGGAADVTELLSDRAAVPAPVQQAQVLQAAARSGTPFCERCAAGEG